jgi:tetratricopeptide (TPR) repeat protein
MVCHSCTAINDDAAASCKSCGASFLVRKANGRNDGAAIALAPTPVPVGRTPSTPSDAFEITSHEVFPDLGRRYEVLSKLGEGGMGAVYKAFDRDLERYVAVKLMRAELVRQPESLQRFKQELLLASRISHKNILRIHDLQESGGTKFFTMAFIEGEDLRSVVERDAPMPIERVVSFALQIADALSAAHSEGVVHRDLKPENVLVNAQEQLFVTDFGLSTCTDNVGATRLTMSGQSLGTPRYMSPEQVQSKPVDQRADLYAFGLILYEMLTGDAPFAGNTVFEQMFQRVQSVPRVPSDLRPGLPAYLENVVLRCLERDPEKRYQSAEEIIRDLKTQSAADVDIAAYRMATNATMAFPALTAPTSSHARARSSRILAYSLGGLLLVGAIAGGAYWYEHSKTVGTTPPASTQPVALTRLAVLPFHIAGDEKALKYIAEGFEDSLTANLSQLQSVNLATQSAVEKLRPDLSDDAVAKQLGIQYVLRGTLQGNQQGIRLTVQMSDPTGKSQPWSYTLDGVPHDILALEGQLFTQITAALKLTTSAEDSLRAGTHGTENLQAYDLYLEGRDAMRGDNSLKNVRAAIGAFEKSVQADPRFALGYAGLASASLQMFNKTKDGAWAQRATGAAEQARRLDDTLPETHFSAAAVYSNTGRTGQAIAELERALKLAPNSDEGYRRLAQTYAAAGNKDKAIEGAKKSIELNPYYWTNFYVLGQIYSQFGDYPKALDQFRKVVELDASNAAGFRNIGIASFAEGKTEESIAPFEKSLQLEPTYETYSDLGTAYFFLKRYSDAVTMYKHAIELNPRDQTVAGNLADTYRLMGEKQLADQTYAKAIQLATDELKINPRDPMLLSSMSLYYAKMGQTARALPLIQRARSIDNKSSEFMSDEAIVQTLAGNHDQALRALDEAFKHGYSVQQAENEPEIQALRADPRFASLAKKFK